MPDIHTIGAALYGRHWQSDLAAELGVSVRTMRRWAAGQQVPKSVYPEIANIARRKAHALENLASEISNIG